MLICYIPDDSACVLYDGPHNYLYLLFAFFFILKRTPDEGHPASSHTLYQKFISLLSSLGPLFQPANLRGVLLIDGMEL